MGSVSMPSGGLSEGQLLAENLELPILRHLGAIAECRKAIDLCSSSRTGVAVIGPKGSGKSAGLELAYSWFSERERALHARENTYAVRRVLRLRAVASKTDRDLILRLAKHLSRTYSDRAGGRRKSVPEMRADVLEMCVKKQYALIMVDEAETYSPQALDCLRDLLADSQDSGSGRVSTAGTRSSGIGMLLVGDEDLLEYLSTSKEAGHRWRQVIDVKPIALEQIAEVYVTWFPGFRPEIANLGNDAWETYLSSVVCRGSVPSFRGVENHARLYAHYMARHDPAITARERIPLHRPLFQLAAQECSWASEVVTPNRSDASPRRRRRKAGKS